MIAGWLIAFITVFGAVFSVGAAYDAGVEIPDSESRRGFDALDEHFGSGQRGSIVLRTADGIDDPVARGAMEEMFAEVTTFEGVTLSSPVEGVGAATQVIADRARRDPPVAGPRLHSHCAARHRDGHARA